MKISFTRFLLFSIIALAFTSCKTYTMVHYKSTELDKIKNLHKYTVYVHDKDSTYKAGKAVLSKAGVTVSKLTPIKDRHEIAEIKNPNTPEITKKHHRDLSLYTKANISADSAKTLIKKGEITDLTHTTFTSTGPAIGNTIATVIVSALCVGMLYGVYRAFSH